MTALPPVCVLAGGLGTRLGSKVADTPKPLLTIAGRPFLAWQLDLVASHGARRAVLCVGYRGEQIEQAMGLRFGDIELRYRYDPPGLAGTAGAIRGALDDLGDRFLVLYGDTYLRIDYRAVADCAERSGKPALMTVLRNEGAWDTSNATFDGRLVRYDKRTPTPDMSWIDYGLGVLEPAALELVPDAADLADVYGALSARDLLAGYPATERFYEIGTPEAFAETERFLSTIAA